VLLEVSPLSFLGVPTVPPKIAAAIITAAAVAVNFLVTHPLYSEEDGSNWRATSIARI